VKNAKITDLLGANFITGSFQDSEISLYCEGCVLQGVVNDSNVLLLGIGNVYRIHADNNSSVGQKLNFSLTQGILIVAALSNSSAETYGSGNVILGAGNQKAYFTTHGYGSFIQGYAEAQGAFYPASGSVTQGYASNFGYLLTDACSMATGYANEGNSIFALGGFAQGWGDVGIDNSGVNNSTAYGTFVSGFVETTNSASGIQGTGGLFYGYAGNLSYAVIQGEGMFGQVYAAYDVNIDTITKPVFGSALQGYIVDVTIGQLSNGAFTGGFISDTYLQSGDGEVFLGSFQDTLTPSALVSNSSSATLMTGAYSGTVLNTKPGSIMGAVIQGYASGQVITLSQPTFVNVYGDGVDGSFIDPNGAGAVVFGTNLQAPSVLQLTAGICNNITDIVGEGLDTVPQPLSISHNDSLFVVGNGESDGTGGCTLASNAMVVTKNGDVYIAGEAFENVGRNPYVGKGESKRGRGEDLTRLGKIKDENKQLRKQAQELHKRMTEELEPMRKQNEVLRKTIAEFKQGLYASS